MALRVAPLQFSAGVTPDADLRADVKVESVYVLLVDGVMPAAASQLYVGSVWAHVKKAVLIVDSSANLEELDNGVEEGDSFSASRAAGRQARRLQGAIASSMRAPLVLSDNVSDLEHSRAHNAARHTAQNCSSRPLMSTQN